MTRPSIANVRLSAFFLVCLTAPAQSIVVGTHAADGKIAFESVDDFQINGSHKIRLAPDQKTDVDPRRLNKIDISQASLIRSDTTGRLVNLNGPGLPRDIVLPENDNARGRLNLSLTRKGSKQPDPIPPDLFFVVLYGTTADESIRDFLSKDWAFQSFDEQLAAMRGFVASFPSSPATRVFRDSLERRITAGLARLEEGGPYKDFLTIHRLSEFALQSFPGDASLEHLNERVNERIQFITDRPKLLRSLAALGDWDTLLDKYQDFERYESSFPEMQKLHQEALEESARSHAGRARSFEQRGDFDSAVKEATLALARDPSNKEIRKLLNDEKLSASQGEALSNASRRKTLPKGLAADLRFSTAIAAADQALADKDYKKAADSIQDADHENPGAPEVILLRARLYAAQGRDADALPLLDQYDRLVVGTAEREKGYEVRRLVSADLDKLRDGTREQIASLWKDGQYSQVDVQLRSVLRQNPDDPEFLYEGGVTAAILRDNERARQILNQFLVHANAIGIDPAQREKARRILAILNEPALPKASGKPYDPQSLMFTIPLDNVSGNKAHLVFNWTGGRLASIRANFDDDKGALAYRQLVIAGAAESGALSAAATGNAGTFFFTYHPSGALREITVQQITPKPFSVHVVHDDQGHPRLIDEDGRTEIVLPDHPNVNPSVLEAIEGQPVTTIAAGDSFFNPFFWDGIHWFTLHYDRQGRAESAREWNADNLVRFQWEGTQLTAIRAFHKNSETPYYQRTITATGEDYNHGKIRYGPRQIKIENDGKDWTATVR